VFPEAKPLEIQIGADEVSLTANIIVDFKIEKTPGQWVDDSTIYISLSLTRQIDIRGEKLIMKSINSQILHFKFMTKGKEAAQNQQDSLRSMILTQITNSIKGMSSIEPLRHHWMKYLRCFGSEMSSLNVDFQEGFVKLSSNLIDVPLLDLPSYCENVSQARINPALQSVFSKAKELAG
jgi:hypothetical protein